MGKKKIPLDLRIVIKARGFSIAGWARANGWNPSTTRAALRGIRLGPLSQKIRRHVGELK